MGSERQRLGDFEIVREIGRGGMGVVYEAIQLSLNRKVALKVLPPGTTPEQRDIERFRREAQAAAQLDHPNIVPIYAQGEEEGTHYYAMKLVQGRSLNQIIRETREKWEAIRAGGGRTRLSQKYFRTAARLIMEVAAALEYAHSQGVIHRDIKPHNLILTPEGHPVITDFGLARFLSAPSMTISGEMMGTPAYMSPEQVRTEQQAIDHRTDVYSLGITLYEMLALEVPFRAETRDAVLRQILVKDPPPLRRINPRIPRDLETICHKGIEKDPNRRYQSAQLFAHDLHCFLEGLPITARPVGPVGHLYRRAMRRKALAAALSGGLLALIAGGYFGARSYLATRRAVEAQYQAEAEKRRAEGERQARVVEAAARAEERHWRLLGQGRADLASGNYPAAKGRFLEAAKINCSLAARLCLWQLAQHFQDTPELTLTDKPLSGSGYYPVVDTAVSPDGAVLAYGTDERVVKLWEVASGRQLRVLKTGYIWSLAFSPDGRTLALGLNAPVELWDVTTGARLHSLRGHTLSTDALAFSPNGKVLASGCGGGQVLLWDVESGNKILAPTTDMLRVTSLAFSADGTMLAAAGHLTASAADGATPSAGQSRRDRAVKLYEVSTGRELRTFTGHAADVTSVALSPDGGVLATGSEDRTVKLWETATGREQRTLRLHSRSVTCVAFSPDGQVLASGAEDGTVRVWDVASGAELGTVDASGLRVNSVGFSPEGTLWASASSTAGVTVKVWSMSLGQGLRTFRGHTDLVTALTCTPDGKHMVSVSDDGTARVWDAATWSLAATVSLWDATAAEPPRTRTTLAKKQTLYAAWASALSPPGDTVAVAVEKAQPSYTWSEEVQLWDRAAGRRTRTLKAYAAHVVSLAFAADGKLLAVGYGGGGLVVWDVATGELTHPLATSSAPGGRRQPFLGHANCEVTALAFAPNGELLASGCDDETVRLWDTATGQERLRLEGHEHGVRSLAFSPDGKVLAATSESEVKLWDTSTAEQLQTLEGHALAANSVAFSPDGKLLASGSSDKTLKLWDPASGREMVVLGPLPATVGPVVFGPEGER